MILGQFDGFMWLAITLTPILFLQPRLHTEIQRLFLLITRRSDLSIILFSLLFFPGVLLHELSHFVMARLLGVRTGRFSLIPKDMGNGHLQLGYVEVEVSDVVREALIGAAPLITGGAFVAYAGLVKLNMTPLWASLLAGNPGEFLNLFMALPSFPDFWVWAYFALTISSTMFPSASDRRAWWPLLGIMVVLILFAWGLGVSGWLLVVAVPFLNENFRALSVVFGLTTIGHIVFYIPVFLLQKAVSSVTGLEIVEV